MKIRKAIVVFLAMLVSHFKIIGQINTPNIAAPSSNIANSLGKIQLANDLYNGKVNVAIPLYNYNFKGLNFPVSLVYVDGNGVKTDELPSWAGLGWSLQLGGFVNRTVRGEPDEFTNIQTTQTKIINSFELPKIRTIKTTLSSADYSYFDNYNLLKSANWYTETFANTLKPGNHSTFPVTQIYPNPSGDGSAIVTTSNQYALKDLVPDEFSFSALGVSGKFYMNQDGKWIVTTDDNRSYKVDVKLGSDVVFSNYKIQRLIKCIILTSNEGIKYTFGNASINAPYGSQIYEYSRASTQAYPEPYSTPFAETGTTYLDIVAHTWHLTKVENMKNNTSIQIQYFNPGYQFYESYQAWGNQKSMTYKNSQVGFSNPSDFYSMYYLSALSRVATRIWLPQTVTFSNGVEIKINASPSHQLGSNRSLSLLNIGPVFNEYFELQGNTSNNVLYKIDSIDISYENKKQKQVAFNYIDTITQRLKLISIKEKSVGADKRESTLYSFRYIPKSLPEYATGYSDHWGYYNNKNFFVSNNRQVWDYAIMKSYWQYREPDTAYTDAEMLNKINYQTGGGIEFVYEPNSYSKKRDSLTYAVLNLAQDKYGGGVRIKNIKYLGANGELEYEKRYSYKALSNGRSSGVLGPLAEIYLDSVGIINDNELWFEFSSSGYRSINYSGPPVSYSSVEETMGRNGSILYEFSNYDNGFNDKLPIQFNIEKRRFTYAFQNNSFKRGKLLSKTVKNQNGDILTQSAYSYQHNLPASQRNQNELRSVYFQERGSMKFRYASVSDSLYNDYLYQEVDNYKSGNSLISVQKRHTYDSSGMEKETAVTKVSNGKIKTTKFVYASDFTALTTSYDEFSKGIEKLLSSNCSGFPVEKIEIESNSDGTNQKVTGSSLFVYREDRPELSKVFHLQIAAPVPIASFKQSKVEGGVFAYDSRYNTDMPESQFLSYDAFGNILVQENAEGIKTLYSWGYSGQYPVAKVVNAQSYPAVYAIQSQYNVVQIPSIPDTTFITTGGTITIKLITNVGYIYKLQYDLSGPRNEGGIICASGTNTTCSSPQTVSFNNMPEGEYTFTISNYDAIGIPNKAAAITYDANVVVIPERYDYFYEGFEEDGNASSKPYAGTGYQTGGYTVPYKKPSNKRYIIDYRYFDGTNWKYKSMDYTDNMSLSEGTIDEVRVYAAGAEMTTYTYSPLIGITSETGPSGATTFYEYDGYGRVINEKDESGNTLKVYNYNYKTQ